jgi:purine-binding chemotaxis protein CheW
MNDAAARLYCTFYLRDECFALEIGALREIDRRIALTPVRGAAAAVRGLASLRGRIATVIDPAVRLGQPPCALGDSARLIVLETRGELVGLCVDRVADVIAIPDREIEPLPGENVSSASALIEGVAWQGGESVRILSAERLLALGDAR